MKIETANSSLTPEVLDQLLRERRAAWWRRWGEALFGGAISLSLGMVFFGIVLLHSFPKELWKLAICLVIFVFLWGVGTTLMFMRSIPKENP